ncbi:hypothetical protein HII31_09630, partial [Pseudocercospora fuligena]
MLPAEVQNTIMTSSGDDGSIPHVGVSHELQTAAPSLQKICQGMVGVTVDLVRRGLDWRVLKQRALGFVEAGRAVLLADFHARLSFVARCQPNRTERQLQFCPTIASRSMFALRRHRMHSHYLVEPQSDSNNG